MSSLRDSSLVLPRGRSMRKGNNRVGETGDLGQSEWERRVRGNRHLCQRRSSSGPWTEHLCINLIFTGQGSCLRCDAVYMASLTTVSSDSTKMV